MMRNTIKDNKRYDVVGETLTPCSKDSKVLVKCLSGGNSWKPRRVSPTLKSMRQAPHNDRLRLSLDRRLPVPSASYLFRLLVQVGHGNSRSQLGEVRVLGGHVGRRLRRQLIQLTRRHSGINTLDYLTDTRSDHSELFLSFSIN